MITIYRPGSAVIFFLLFLLFLYKAVSNGSRIVIDEKKAYKRIAGVKTQELSWGMVREIGVCNTKVFKGLLPFIEGFLYIYISSEEMNEQERFDMILKWPPKKNYYFVYSEQRLTSIQSVWNSKITIYNADDFVIAEKPKS